MVDSRISNSGNFAVADNRSHAIRIIKDSRSEDLDPIHFVVYKDELGNWMFMWHWDIQKNARIPNVHKGMGWWYSPMTFSQRYGNGFGELVETNMFVPCLGNDNDLPKLLVANGYCQID